MALIFDSEFLSNEIARGPLEILLTVEEETGLTGAFGADIEKLQGLNEDWQSELKGQAFPELRSWRPWIDEATGKPKKKKKKK